MVDRLIKRNILIYIYICYGDVSCFTPKMDSSNRNIFAELSYHHHHHLVVPSVRISLTFSRHTSLSFIASGRSSRLHAISSQQCPACLVRLTCIVFVMGGKCPYSWCLVGCCRLDLFNTALNILL